MPEVEAVVINYKRPKNIVPIISALRKQTVDVRITIIDASPEGYEMPYEALRAADRTFGFSHNYGSFNRFMLLGAYDLPFTYFTDDDQLPGPRCIEHFVHHAKEIKTFGVLGQFGRIQPEPTVYRGGPRLHSNATLKVDSLVRGYFVRSECLHRVLWFRHKLLESGITCTRNDDLMLCYGMRYFGLPCYQTTAWAHEERQDARELPDDFAMWKDPAHVSGRSDFLRQLHVHKLLEPLNT